MLWLQLHASVSSPNTSLQSVFPLNGNKAGRFHRWLSLITALTVCWQNVLPSLNSSVSLRQSGVCLALRPYADRASTVREGNSKDLLLEIPHRAKSLSSAARHVSLWDSLGCQWLFLHQGLL